MLLRGRMIFLCALGHSHAGHDCEGAVFLSEPLEHIPVSQVNFTMLDAFYALVLHWLDPLYTFLMYVRI